MRAFDASTYGDSFADVYDEWYSDASDAQAMADFVARLGRAQRILELGTGTGRLAKPLAESGHSVVGVDSSTAMLERFGAPGAMPAAALMEELPLATESFDTVLVATNSFFNVASAAAQEHCLVEVRRVLAVGGRLVLEADVPAPPSPELDNLVTTRSITPAEVVLTAAIRDSTAQTVTGQHIQISERGIRLRPWKIRYADVDELDDMATGAGLQLVDRWAGWRGETFGPASAHHVSLYVAV